MYIDEIRVQLAKNRPQKQVQEKLREYIYGLLYVRILFPSYPVNEKHKMEAGHMNEGHIAQTPFDQMISSDRGQLIKAAIPYLSPKGRRILSVYEKSAELLRTISVFGGTDSGGSLSAMSVPVRDPVDMINEIRGFCYGSSRNKLDQMVNMIAMVQMLQLMNQPDDTQNREESNE